MRKVKGVFPLMGESDTGKDKTLSNTLEQAYPGRVALLPDAVLYGKDETKIADTALRQYAYKVLLLNNDVDLSKVPDQMLNKNLANCTAQAKRKAYDTQSVATSSLPTTFISVNDHNNRKMSDSVRNKTFPVYTSVYDPVSKARTPMLKRYTQHRSEADGESVFWVGDMACRDMLAHAVCDNAENGGPWRKAEVFIAFGLRVLQRDVEAFEGRGAYLPTLRYPQALLEQRNLRQGALPDPGRVAVMGGTLPTNAAASHIDLVTHSNINTIDELWERTIRTIVDTVEDASGAFIKPIDVAKQMKKLCTEVVWQALGGPADDVLEKSIASAAPFGKDIRERFATIIDRRWTEKPRRYGSQLRVHGSHMVNLRFRIPVVAQSSNASSSSTS